MGLGSRLSLKVPNKGIDLSSYIVPVGRIVCCTTVIKNIVCVWGSIIL